MCILQCGRFRSIAGRGLNRKGEAGSRFCRVAADIVSAHAGALRMKVRTVVLLAVASVLSFIGLIGRLHSSEAALRHPVLSLAIVAIGPWRMPVKQAARRRFCDRKRPPDRG
jgi:hypothetical protein